MTANLVRLLLLAALAQCLAGCVPPPQLTRFQVAPAFTCPTVPVGVEWTADADEMRITASPDVGLGADGANVPPAGGGFLFDTAHSDTVFTGTARRGSHPPAVRTATARVVSDPFDHRFALEYDCGNLDWRRDGFSPREFHEVLTVIGMTNHGREPVRLEHLGVALDLRPGETLPTPPRVRFNSGRWIATPLGVRPQCTGGPGSTAPGTPVSRPPPLEVTVRSSCPAPRRP